MKIKKLDQHCGDCGVSEYCGNSFGYCLCKDNRFGDMEENEYKKIAETATAIKPLDACEGCRRTDCGSYRYSEEDYENEDCEHEDEARDFACEQIADFVETVLREKIKAV